jgi:two-component system sensor histidine kinase QseC
MAIVPASLRGRLILSLVLLFLFGTISTAVYQINLAGRDWYAVSAQTMQGQAEALSAAYDRDMDRPLAAMSADWRAVYTRPGSEYGFTIYDRFLRPVESSPSLRGQSLPLRATPEAGKRFGDLAFIGPSSKPILAVSLPDGGYAVVSRGGGWNEALVESIEHERLETVLLFVSFAGLALVLTMIMLFWTMRPLAEASRQAAAIGPDGFNQRIDASGLPSEIQPLVQAFNGALARLGEANGMHRRFAANAAHELRTPLAVLSLRLQRVRMGEAIDWPAIIEDLARMQRLLDQLLDLARKRSSAFGGGERAEINLSRVIREAAALMLPLAEERGRPLDMDIPPSILLADARGDDLRDMARNLIENALLHGRGRVSVRLAREPGGTIRLAVADEGAPPADGDALFDEFRKGDGSVNGSGLGLAIVQQVATAHHGKARFGDGPTTVVEVVLPA